MRTLLPIFIPIITLLGCSSQLLENEVSSQIFDSWCDYAVAGQADNVTQDCIDNANQGDEDAATNLAYLYAKGMLVEQDIHRAMDLYRVAAEKGMPEAQYSLAEMYRSGKVGKANPKLARYWYQQLASQPIDMQFSRYQVDAQFMLGLMYFEGQGGAVDLNSAEHWLKQSSDNGHKEAPYILGQLYLEQYHNPQQALDWYKVSADRKFAPAMHQIGMIYVNGQLGEVEVVKADFWLQQAAALGLAEAQVDLATLEYNHRDDEADLIKIYIWLAAAKHQGNEIAANRLQMISQKLSQPQLNQAQALSLHCIQSLFQQCQAATLLP
ncbi:sel1 repeat family protein [Shewanella marinintestina]|uniref:tetratricopeptide repeat protein n=1 Tax=Shewanella marinintestina TaxID=190305 RepID=UPI00200BAB21|nr:tetratricopeptide repeat protein [Shewanella marinintestina]MCL1146540.1 sel1 repeat family protein [Shewanella marinintestina]